MSDKQDIDQIAAEARKVARGFHNWYFERGYEQGYGAGWEACDNEAKISQPKGEPWTVERDGAICGIVKQGTKIIATGIHYELCLSLADAHNASIQK